MDAEVWPDPAHLKTWTDTDGCEWRRRGDRPLTLVEARRTFTDAATIVMHFNGPVPTRVEEAEPRAELWGRIESTLRGRPESPFSDFRIFQYRNADGRTLVAVAERC